jgi:hypothetical protein
MNGDLKQRKSALLENAKQGNLQVVQQLVEDPQLDINSIKDSNVRVASCA